MEGKVIWKQRLSFSGTAGLGFEVPIGTKAAGGGDDDGFSPMELILVGLAGCTAMDVISILQKKQQAVTGFEVRVSATRVEAHPRVFNHALVEYVVTGHQIAREAVERAVELSDTKYCSVSMMLSKAFPIEHKITILEA